MKRQIETESGGTIRTPAPLKKEERQFGAAMKDMIDLMARIFRNQALLELNKGTVDKFADSAPALTEPEIERYGFTDAQIGNYARVFLGLARKVTKKLRDRFSFVRLDEISRRSLEPVNERSRQSIYKQVAEATGLDYTRLVQEEGLKSTTNALMLETAVWAEKLRDDTLEFFVANSLRAMAEGQSLEQVLSQFDGMVEQRKRHAEMVARTQIATFNSLVTKTRAQNLGIQKAVWITSSDERVRKCHKVRDGKEFDLAKGLYSSCDGKWLLPGVDFQCRCTSRLLIPKREE